MSLPREDTALGVARARFVEGLPRRTRELKGAIALLTAAPGDARGREELRRRLHALFASAQVFRIERLADGLKSCIIMLDSAREGHRPLSDAELESLARVALALPELAASAASEGASVARAPVAPQPDASSAQERAEENEAASGAPFEAGGPGVPARDELARAKAPRPERQSVEEVALKLAVVGARSEESAPRTDDPFEPIRTPMETSGDAGEGDETLGGERAVDLAEPASGGAAARSSSERTALTPEAPMRSSGASERAAAVRSGAGATPESARSKRSPALERSGAAVSGPGSARSKRSPALERSGAAVSGPGSERSKRSPALERSGAVLSGPGSERSKRSPALERSGAARSGVGADQASESSASSPASKRASMPSARSSLPVNEPAVGSRPANERRSVPSPAEPESMRFSRPVSVGATTSPAVVAPLPPARVRSPKTRSAARPEPRPSSSPAFGLPTVLSVLVVDDAQSIAKLRETLPAERFEVMSASDPEEALRLARAAAPDVVLASKTVVELREIDFVARLRSDPLNGNVPLVLTYPAGRPLDAEAVARAGADDAIAWPIDPEALASRLAQLCGLDGRGPGVGRLGDMTVAEVADRLAEEIRRGLADSVAEGSSVPVPLGVGSEVLATAWSAIARVRSHVHEASRGRVRFRDPPRRGAPTVVGIVDGLDQEGDGPEIALAGRTLLVADDDPAVLWFFSQLLREAGARVVEAKDGVDALELARRERPEAVLSDILMPRMDGMALCREIARDPALGATPVILLSWKEDFLERMRELRAGAQGYLRKEEGTAQILRSVREALRPRANMERMLRAGGEVRGRVEQLGVVPMLRVVSRERPNARVLVRDAHSLFEIDLREGAIVDVTRTATDGAFVRGERALSVLVGVADGRFTVVDGDAAVRPTIEGSIDEALDEVCSKLGALIDAVSGAGLGRAAHVELDPETVDALLASSPGRAGEVVEKLRGGAGPADLLVSGGIEPQLLESVLVDLARRGGVRRVSGPAGEDRIAEALARRLPPMDAGHETEAPTPSPPAEASPIEPGAPALETAPDDLRALAGGEAPHVEDLPTVSPAEVAAAPHVEDLAAVSPAEVAAAPRVEDLVAVSPAESGAGVRVEEPISSSEELDLSLAREVRSAHEPEPEPSSDARAGTSEDAPGPSPSAGHAASLAPPSHAPVEPARRSRGLRFVGWGAALLVLCGLGYWAARAAQFATGDGDAAQPAAEPGAVHTAVAEPEGESDQPDQAPAHLLEGEPRLYGRSIPRIVSEDVAVGEGQGLLRVEAEGPQEGVELLIGERSFGAPPLDVALDEGVHELAFRSGDQLRYRYVFVRAGESRVVPAP